MKAKRSVYKCSGSIVFSYELLASLSLLLWDIYYEAVDGGMDDGGMDGVSFEKRYSFWRCKRMGFGGTGDHKVMAMAGCYADRIEY